MRPTPNVNVPGTNGTRQNNRIPNKICMNDWLEVVLALLKDGVTVHIDVQMRADNPDTLHKITCEYCGWHTVKASKSAAQRALRSHHQHCTARAEEMQWIESVQDQESHDD